MLHSQLSKSSQQTDNELCQINYYRIKEISASVDLSQDYRDVSSSRYYWFVESGGGVAVINHEEFELCPGAVVMIPANTLYRFHLRAGTDGMVFSGADHFMRTKVATGLYTTPSSFQETYYKPSVSYQLAGDKNAAKRHKIFSEMADAASHLGMGCDAAVMGYIFVLLADGNLPEAPLAQDPPVKSTISSADLIYDFQVLVERHYREHISIDCYCKKLSISRVKLIEACKQLLNKTPLEILHDRLMLEAKQQLMIASTRVSDVAYSLGFEDSAYFSRFFKNQTKESPSEFKRSHAGQG